MGKTCCVTGHREYPAEREEWIRERLYDEVGRAISEGFTTFISGFADGVDLVFAEIVAEYKEQNPNIFLEAALPYRKRINSPNPKFQKLIKKTSGISVSSEEYHKDCYLVRNRYMVQQSQRLIAVYDPEKPNSGTGSTMRYAHAVQVETVVIEL